MFMLLVDATFCSRGHGGIAQDNRNFVRSFQRYESCNFLLDKGSNVFDSSYTLELPISMRYINLTSLLVGRNVNFTKNWPGDFYQTHITGMKTLAAKGKTYLRLHDLFPITNPEWFNHHSRRIFEIGLKSISPNTVLVCNSETTRIMAESLKEFAKIEKIVVPCTVDFEPTSACGECFGCNNSLKGINFLLTIGTLEPRKNYENLLSAWINTTSQHDFEKLVIVGRNGWKNAGLIARIESLRDVLWITPCDFALKRIQDEAGGYISPSLAEGFDIPALSAYECGLPIAVSDISVHRELIKCADFYFDPCDITSISEAIITISRIKEKTKRANSRLRNLEILNNFVDSIL